MSKLLTVWHFVCRYKYLITVLIFLVVLGVLDENSLVRRYSNKREIGRLHEEIGNYRREYDESTRKLNELMENSEAIEKIAREKYLMKKPNEDIYIIEEVKK